MKKNFGKISIGIILMNLMFLCVYLANKDNKTESITDENLYFKEVITEEESTENEAEEEAIDLEAIAENFMYEDALAVENENGWRIYRDEDVTDEQVQMLINRLYRLQQGYKGSSFIEACNWYVTSDPTICSMMDVDWTSLTMLVYCGDDYETNLSILVNATEAAMYQAEAQANEK